MSTLLGLLLFFALGWITVILIAPKIPRAEQICLSFPIGAGLQTILMFYGSLLGIRITLANSLGILFLFFGILYALAAKKKLLPKFKNLSSILKKGVPKHVRWYEWLILLFIVGLIGLNLTNTIYWPVFMWDALYAFDYNAKLYVHYGTIYEAARSQGGAAIHAYQPFISLAHAFFYLLGSVHPKLMYSGLLISSVGLFYISLTRYTNRFLGLLFTLFYLMAPLPFYYAGIAYTNFPFTLYYAFGSIYLFHWIKNKKSAYFFIGAIILGLSYWVRPHAFYFFAATYAVIALYCILSRKYFLHLVLLVLITLSFGYPWEQYHKKIIQPLPSSSYFTHDVSPDRASYESDVGSGINKENIQNIFSTESIQKIFVYIYKAIRDSLDHLFYIFPLIVLLNIPYLRKENGFMLLMILGNIGMFIVGTFALALVFWRWDEIGNSAVRLFMFMIPMILFYIGTSGVVKKCFYIPLDAEQKSKDSQPIVS